jgi:hypothetical protein
LIDAENAGKVTLHERREDRKTCSWLVLKLIACKIPALEKVIKSDKPAVTLKLGGCKKKASRWQSHVSVSAQGC